MEANSTNDVIAFNKAQIFAVLEKAGLSMSATYWGENDEGSSYELSFHSNDSDCKTFDAPPAVLFKSFAHSRYSGGNKVEPQPCEMDFESAVESLCNDLLSAAGHDGFEDGTGGGGEFTFDLDGHAILLDHYYNVVERNYRSCKF